MVPVNKKFRFSIFRHSKLVVVSIAIDPNKHCIYMEYFFNNNHYKYNILSSNRQLHYKQNLVILNIGNSLEVFKHIFKMSIK